MSKKTKRPSAAMGVAMLALFVALSGIATAAAVIPLAKRALVADNAKKLGGRTPAQLSAASVAAARAAAQAAAALPGLPAPRPVSWSSRTCPAVSSLRTPAGTSASRATRGRRSWAAASRLTEACSALTRTRRATRRG